MIWRRLKYFALVLLLGLLACLIWTAPAASTEPGAQFPPYVGEYHC